MTAEAGAGGGAEGAETISLAFSPGPLGIELEPVWQAAENSVGCRVAGFKMAHDGTAGQAERLGKVGVGDILTEVNGLAVRGVLFDKIIHLLRQNMNGENRRLSFLRSGRRAATATAPTSPPARVRSTLHTNAEKQTSSSGADTPSTTLSPEPHLPPAPPAAAADAPTANQQRLQSGSMGWARTLLGMGRREPVGVVADEGNRRTHRKQEAAGGEGDGDIETLAVGNVGADGRSLMKGVVRDHVDGGGCHNTSRAAGGAAECGSRDDRPRKKGLFFPESDDRDAPGAGDFGVNGVEESICSNGSSSDTAATIAGGSSLQQGECVGSHLDEFLTERDPSVTAAAEASGHRGHKNNSDGVRAGFTASEYLTAGADLSSRFGSDSRSTEAPAAEAVTSPRLLEAEDAAQDETVRYFRLVRDGRDKSDHDSNTEHLLRENDKLTADTSDEQRHNFSSPEKDECAVGDTPQSPAGHGAVDMITPLAAGERYRLDLEDKGGRQSPPGGLAATERSLDTVSLLSEPASFAIKNGPAGKRRWPALSHIWGDAEQTVTVGGGDRGSTELSSSVNADVDGGEEEVRRLARSLAAKLNERVRRCEELEDLCGLRDHQVEMLQRQSNALAGRVADLSEQLSDKNALADALQAERTRLEQELTQEARRRYTVPPASAGNGNENRGSVATTSSEDFTELAAEPDSNASSANNGDIANSAQPAAAAGDHHDSDRSAAQARAAAVATATAAAAVARISAAEARADAAVLKAEAGTSALSEMVDGLVSEKVQWEEERCAHAAETIRLRARARGLEEALAGNGLVVTEEGREWTVGRGESRLEALRELLRVRTRDLEAERGVSERLAAHVRELQQETRQLSVSLSAREGDVSASDKQMEALSHRLNGDLLEKDVAVARAEAEAEESRRVLHAAKGKASPGDSDSLASGSNSARFMAEKLQWAEERARLQHNLLSLQEVLEEQAATATTEESTTAALLEQARSDRDRFKREAISLQNAVESLRLELAEALSSLAEKNVAHGGVVNSKGSSQERHERRLRSPESDRTSGSADAAANDSLRVVGVEEGEGSRPDVDPTNRTGSDGRTPDRSRGEGDLEHLQSGVSGRDGGDLAVGDKAQADANRIGSGGGEAMLCRGDDDVDARDRRCASHGGAGAQSAGLRHGGGSDGSAEDLQLDLMEKDIEIELLRTQLKQLRSRMAAMEAEAETDTSPLEGLLTQLGELKGTVQEREEREQQCRDQVDQGLLRMERLKEENASATAAVTSPPRSFAGSLGGLVPAVSRQTDLSAHHQQQQAEQQNLRRKIEDLRWELRMLKRCLEEREAQLRDARADINRLKIHSRATERALVAARGETEVAATETAAERRRSGACRAEIQSLRAELRAVRERAAREGQEQRTRLETEARGRLAAESAVSSVEVAARDKEAALKTALDKLTKEFEREQGREREREREREMERRELLLRGRELGGRMEGAGSDEGVQNCARELESVKCALAARDVELAAIADATTGFARQAEMVGPRGMGSTGVFSGGGGALHGALAAATEARRAGRRANELEEECESLKKAAAKARGDILRLQQELEEEQVAKEKAVGAAATAAAAAAAATATASQNIVVSSQPTSSAEARNDARHQAEKNLERALATEETLKKALSGAEQAWRLLTSCLASESEVDDDLDADDAASPRRRSRRLGAWHPAADPFLRELVASAESLAHAHRGRGSALRRARVAVRAKAACAREARRREAGQVRAREEAESRLQDALAALDDNGNHHGFCGGKGNGGAVEVDELGRSCGPSARQQEHLRQIRREVDRLEGQNRSLRLSLVGDRLMRERINSTSGSNGVGEVPTKRTLFPQVLGDDVGVYPGPAGTEVDTQGWEYRPGDGSSGSGRGVISAGSGSPMRSWSAASKARDGASQWPPPEGVGLNVQEGRSEHGGVGPGGNRPFADSCAAGLYDSALQDEGYRDSLVPGYHARA